MTLLIGALTLGLILSLLALGILISFRIFGFPDITPEGSITFGASIAAVLLVKGFSPWVATAAGFGGGFLAGITTGILHTRFKINELLAGILVMTSLYSINLRVMGKSNVPLLSETSLITYCERFGEMVLPGAAGFTIAGWEISLRDAFVLLFAFLLAAIMGMLLFVFMRTNLGTAMRATGDNQQMMKALGVNVNHMIVIGLGLSNAFVALAGALLAQYQGFADVQMGIGMVVLGLASVIIGEALVGTQQLALTITGAVMGSILFRLLVAIALRWGLNPNDLKLITAVFVFIALILPQLLGKIRRDARSAKNF
jgi:putative tryptophan/tyrosine transport system permease protein